MKIGLGIPSRGFSGGIERHVHDLARGLSARGHRLVLVRGPAAGRDEERYAEPFDEVVYHADLQERADLGPLRDADVIYVHRAGAAADLEVYGDRPVVVASHDHELTCVNTHRYLPVSAEPCHRPPGLACVTNGCVVVRDRRPTATLPVTVASPFRLRKETRALGRRAELVACSRYVRDQLVRAGVAPDHVRHIHPIPPEDDAPRRPRPAAPRLVFAGNLLRGKGVDIAIRALAHLREEARLTIVGDGPSRGALTALAERVAPGRVTFAGWVPPATIGEYYDAASVVLVPSRWPEPFGMVGIEAMRRARPVVAAAHGGIPEWASGTRGARLFRPGDPRSLATQARALLDDPGAGEAARSHATRRFPHARLLDEVEALLTEVAAREAAA